MTKTKLSNYKHVTPRGISQKIVLHESNQLGKRRPGVT